MTTDRLANLVTPATSAARSRRRLPPFLRSASDGLRRRMSRWLGLEAHEERLRHLVQEVDLARARAQQFEQRAQHLEVFCAEQYLASRNSLNDLHILHEVAVHNEYRLPEAFAPDDIVIDIGAHIGSFCYAAMTRYCRCVHAFEADRKNYECAAANLKCFGDRVHLHHKAVWRSDRTGDTLYSSGYLGDNAGSVNVYWADSGPKLEVVALDDVIRDVTANGRRRVRLLKIDCEGAEYPVLLTARKLGLVDAIHGEYHDLSGGPPVPPVARVDDVHAFTMPVLARHLETAGFCVEWQPRGDGCTGLFFATRPQVNGMTGL
jgi:FkbM family methyltransferase